MNPKISVIVPVYNAQTTVKDCVNSILGQSFTEIEILLINDGSKDCSLAVISELAKEDTRISVFTKENGGQSSARNLGLEQAKGDYVAFIDSDDTINPDMLSLLYNNAIAQDAELSICGVRLIKNGVDITPQKHRMDKLVFSRKEAIEQLLAEKYVLFSVCDKLYKRTLFDEIRFPVGVIHEDVLLPYQLTTLCNKVVCEMKPMYNYLLND
ncbi:MAG: glycosyltransferase, partial [Oscillospiraceae bacterium]